jgi:hypothetical protein
LLEFVMDLVLSPPAFAWHWPDLRAWWRRPHELRIDVDPPAEGALEQELGTLHGRLYTPGDRLYGLPTEPLPDPRFVMHRREADGEWYVYVEDRAERRLAGYTVLNRLIEVDRHTDPHVRAPHSRYAPAYQRRGLATGVYGWALGAGICLVSGARQSSGAHALWRSLTRRHTWGYVDLHGKRLVYLGRDVPAPRREALPVRMLLLGQGWTLPAFAAAVRMVQEEQGPMGRQRDAAAA